MEKQQEKITKFSKIIYVLLKVAFIALIVVGAFQALAWLWSAFDLETELRTISGVEMEVPVLFKLGDTTVALPITWESGVVFYKTNIPFLEIGFVDFIVTILTIIGLGFTMSVFKKLRETGSPFREDVVKSLKKASIVLLCVGLVAGATVIVAAGIVWVLCLIFDYGRLLQNESDTTL
jgi:fatty acid desaturase